MILVFAASLAVAGCAIGAAPANSPAGAPTGSQSSQATPETQRSIATAIALRAAESGSGGGSGPSMPSGPRTAAEIAASAPSSGGLDNRHLAAGKGCEVCHGAIPAGGRPSKPSSAKCLSCHGGSYEGLAAKTSALGARNPHKAHTGKQDCDRCHGVHRPFEYSCNLCHTFEVPEKYRGSE